MNSSVTLGPGQSRCFHASAMLSRKGDSLHWHPFWSYKYDNEPLVALKCYADVQLPRRHFILKMWIHFQGLKIILHSPTGTGDKNVHVTNFGWVPGGGRAAVGASGGVLLFFFTQSACWAFATLWFFFPAENFENFNRRQTASKARALVRVSATLLLNANFCFFFFFLF